MNLILHAKLIVDLQLFFKATCIILIYSNGYDVATVKQLQYEISSLTDVYIGATDYSFIANYNKTIFAVMFRPMIILLITTNQLSNFMNEFYQIKIITHESVKWIYFHDEKFKELKIFEETNIPLVHEMYTMPLNDTSTMTYITENYNIEPWKNVQKNQIGFWKINQGIVFYEGFSSRRMNLKSVIFNVTTMHHPPFISLDNETHPNKITGGFFGQIWKIIEDKQNCNSRIILPPDNEYGLKTENKSWNGMIGLVERNEVNLAVCDFTLTSERNSFFDFATPIVTTYQLLVLREPENSDFYWTNFLAPFSLITWITFIAVFVIGGICVFIIDRFIRRGLKMNVTEIVFEMFQIISQQGLKYLPKETSLKVVYICLQYNSLIMFITYSAALISFLTVVHFNMPFDSLYTFQQNPSYKLAIMKGSSDFDLLTNSSIFKSIYETQMASKDIQPKNYVDGFIKLCNYSKYVLYAPQIEANVYIDQYASSAEYCPVVSVNTGIPASYSLIVTTKDSPYSKLFNKNILLLRQFGVIARLRLSEFPAKLTYSKNAYQSLTLTEVAPMIFIYLFVVLFVLCIFSMEVLVSRLNSR